MPRVQWELQRGRPCVQVSLTLAPSGKLLSRTLLADTGAGSRRSGFDLILEEDDCLLCGGRPWQSVTLAGAYSGSFPTYHLRVQIPGLGFDHKVRVVCVPSVPEGFDGVACFGFLNRFSYGNFGAASRFGLEQ